MMSQAFDRMMEKMDWARILLESDLLLSEFAQWHILGYGFREGSD